MRFLTSLIIIIAIGLLVGGLSATYLVQRTHGLGAINIGPWSAWPFVGGREIDPYTIARVTSDGTIPLGAAEGLSFEAVSDDRGEALKQECHYIVSGRTSIAQLWTIAAYDEAGQLVMSQNNMKSSIHSGNIVRFPDSSFRINLSHIPLAGNWIPLQQQGNFRLILRLYDTQVISSSGLTAPTMPGIERQDCLS